MFFQFDTGEQKQWKNRTPLVHRAAVLPPATHYHYKGCLLILLLVFRRVVNSTAPERASGFLYISLYDYSTRLP